MWVVGQVIVSINDTLRINWPAPFRGLVDALAFFQFDLALLPVDCVMDYSVYARLYIFRSLAMLGAFNGQEGDGVDPTSPFE